MGKDNEIIDLDFILQRFDAALAVVAQDVGNEIANAFESAIDSYYSSYYPTRRYRRTGSMRFLSSGHADPSSISKRIGDYQYEAGIEVNPKYVSGNPYEKNPHHGLHVTPKFVYNISYLRGIHGFNRGDLFFKRDEETGALLRGDKGNENKKQVLRKDNWKPGYNPLSGLIGRNGIFLDDDSLESIVDKYHANYNAKEHTPRNSIAPDVNVRTVYRDVCKSLDKKISSAIRSMLG